MRTAIYSRVSTDKQSHESQLVELRDYCQRRGWEGVQEFSDVINGARFTREGLDGLMGLVRRGLLDVVVVFKLDRLGRSLTHLAQLCSELNSHKVALVCTRDGIDTSTDSPTAKLQLGMLMVVAEFERTIMRERILAGVRAAQARGVQFGHKKTRDQYKPKVRELHAAGHAGRLIARMMGINDTVVWHLIQEIKAENAALPQNRPPQPHAELNL